MKDFRANINWHYYKELRKTTWYNNLMTESGSFSLLRPQIWRSFCHLMDWGNRRISLVIDGISVFSAETRNYSTHFTDNNKEWPKAKLMRIAFGPKFKDVSDGKVIGNLTDLNIFRSNIGNKTAMEITG